MTEEEWLECENLEVLWPNFPPNQVGDRPWRLFACACCRSVPKFMKSDPDVLCLKLAEQEADDPQMFNEDFYPKNDRWDVRWYRRDAQSVARRAMTFYRDFIWLSARSASNSEVAWDAVHSIADRPLAEFFRDIFGNPFRPVVVDPTWLTSTVVALAEGIYQERAFDRMPILADALEDAGCDHADLLNHCRGDGPHVRGCWVVDLLTGRK